MTNIAQLLTEHMAIWTAADTEKKTGRGRSIGNAGSVYGVKKLRELILELAVRGKLVPQDVNDEPASELLRRIQAEKAKLVTEGKLKKEKPLAPIGEDGKPFQLPNGWEYASFGDVVEIVRGITFPGSEKTKTPENGRVACLRTTNVQDQIEWEDILYIREQFISRDDQILMPNDIVMSMANSRELVGKVALVGNEIMQRTSFGGFLGVIRPYYILPKFVVTLLRTPHTREELIDSASQTTNIANISLAKLRPLFFAIPPLAEQHRIVSKVDELMALCDKLEQQHSNAQEAHETLVSQLLGTLTQSQNAEEFNANWQRIYAHFDVLFTTEASVDKLKQTLLQLAVIGKLVPQDPNDEPARELLKCIQADKAKLVAEGKIKKDKPLVPIGDDEKPFELPKGWELVRKGEVFSFLNGYAFKSEWFESSGIKLLRNINVSHGSANWEDVVNISIERAANFKEYSLNVGDIVLTLDRPIITTGLKYAVISNTDVPCLLLQRVARISSLSKSVISEYLSIWLNSSFFVDNIDPGRSNGVPHISTTQVSNMVFPLPPLAEQHRIVAKADELMALCDQLKTRIQLANLQQQALADALVAQVVAA